MILIVESGDGPDKRKGKTLVWKQANLCCARSIDQADAIYGATMASMKIAGLLWAEVAKGAGWSDRTFVHGVADGADPIFNAFREQFGEDETKARFTVDLFHVNEYLAEAAEVAAPSGKEQWRHELKGLLLESKVQKVLDRLESHFEPLEQEPAPVRTA
jgi:hypothetical protein